ncbi:MAG: SDR family NAD(P)-dependent oxidoreductase [Glaciecola sp.]|jgi:NAD(P)-dependent dehydrogenase (short-subunit alcohol dehydrogenase family)|uniref:SDR family NAD(P)-dependent oxidoreductase n=1 Tax=Glaciecola sp. HTCC2999 TaxID=455436 RepID=UPI0000E11037|nr:SDR family NAD(P)-dependent oxidoreductase [Glaciecola sp. HTCC2999]
MTIRYDNQVAIITGAGAGLGRSHALALARRGAKVVVNDLAQADGTLSAGALSVVAEIEAEGGEAMANGANVAKLDEVELMISDVMAAWGRIDILVNNAGILRDKSFTKMPMDDFGLILDVHLLGSANCSKAVWPIMRTQQYGRIVMTTSSSGLYGNFGQANYGAAKMGVVGLMNTLCIEGLKDNIYVNCLSPTARTAMTEALIEDERVLDLMTVESVSAGLLALVAEQAPNRTILACGSGGYAKAVIKETDGIYLSPEEQTPENVLAQWDNIVAEEHAQELQTGWLQTNKFVSKAAQFLGINLADKIIGK